MCTFSLLHKSNKRYFCSACLNILRGEKEISTRTSLWNFRKIPYFSLQSNICFCLRRRRNFDFIEEFRARKIHWNKKILFYFCIIRIKITKWKKQHKSCKIPLRFLSWMFNSYYCCSPKKSHFDKNMNQNFTIAITAANVRVHYQLFYSVFCRTRCGESIRGSHSGECHFLFHPFYIFIFHWIRTKKKFPLGERCTAWKAHGGD